MTNKEEFLKNYPDVYFLDADHLESIGRYLQAMHWLNPSETVRAAGRAGEGNMNYTLRVATSERTFILKQARPWVEKYRHIPAPWERALVEGAFYQLISTHPVLSEKMPRLLGMDPRSRILMLEDLGDAQDFTFLYGGDIISELLLDELVSYLSYLHGAFRAADGKAAFTNRAMRALNHQHIFHIPLAAGNSLNLDSITPGLDQAAQRLKQDTRFVSVVTELSALYLADGNSLLHGDYFPGSWLRTGRGVAVIDPEFCFFGPPEFDVGVMIAHLLLANQPGDRIERLLGLYQSPPSFDRALALRFAGVEIMRRLIGVAQLPLRYGLETKSELLERSHQLVLNPNQGESL